MMKALTDNLITNWLYNRFDQCSLLAQKSANNVKFFAAFSHYFLATANGFLLFEITVVLFGCSFRRNAIFSSSGSASDAVSLKFDVEVPKVAEKDALCYLKFFFVSFVLRYVNKEKKTLGSLHVRWPFFLFEIAQNFE